MDRRAFLTGMLFVAATPAIVRAASLMPVKVMPVELTEAAPFSLDAVKRAVEELEANDVWLPCDGRTVIVPPALARRLGRGRPVSGGLLYEVNLPDFRSECYTAEERQAMGMPDGRLGEIHIKVRRDRSGIRVGEMRPMPFSDGWNYPMADKQGFA